MSAADYNLSGTYRPCRACEAPIVSPFPPDWQIELIKEGPPKGPVKSYTTPHRETCTAPPADPQPGMALRLPGSTVASTEFGMPPPPSRADSLPSRVEARPGLLFHAPAGTWWPGGGWVNIGHTDGGTISGDGLTWETPDEPPDLSSDAISVLSGGATSTTTYWAVSDMEAGTMVQRVDGDFVKPVVPFDVDATPPDTPAVEP